MPVGGCRRRSPATWPRWYFAEFLASQGWHQEQWLHHCGDAAEFHGCVGARELAAFPDAVKHLRSELAGHGWPADQVTWYLQALSKDGQPTAYLFRCRRCGTHLAYSDST